MKKDERKRYAEIARHIRSVANIGYDTALHRYNWDSLWHAVYIYFIVVDYFNRDYHGRHISKMQIDEICLTFFRKELCLNRARGGSKTNDMGDAFIIAGILGWEPLYYAASWPQLTRVQIYWKANPFVERPFVVKKMRDHVELVTGARCTCCALTDANTRGPRGDYLIYDEVSQMDAALYNASAGVQVVSLQPHTVFISTPQYGTLFHELCNTVETITHTYLELPFLNREVIERQRLRMPAWFWRQEYMCTFEKPSGAVFGENLFDTAAPSDTQWDPRPYIGVDPNPHAGNALVIGRWSEDNTIFEATFSMMWPIHSKSKLIDFLGKYPTANVEVEENGVGGYWEEDIIDRWPYARLYPVNWTDKTKYERVINLFNKKIYINQHTLPKLLKQVRGLGWTPDGKIEKIKGADNHLADAFLHAAQVDVLAGGEIYGATEPIYR